MANGEWQTENHLKFAICRLICPSRLTSVIPAKAGIQLRAEYSDPRFRGGDDGSDQASSLCLTISKEIAGKRILPGWEEAKPFAFEPRVGKS